MNSDTPKILIQFHPRNQNFDTKPDPACVKVCPDNAIQLNDDGIILPIPQLVMRFLKT